MPSRRIKFLKAGAAWEICINDHPTGILIDRDEKAAAAKWKSVGKIVIHFMQTLDQHRWERFKAAYEKLTSA
ncbi:MAG TPA: hypothetical protein VG733_07505 [Chthoniobacteraceae bacterium]|nr:hypothetical protein [Chthoniobacteraceae bacterium]